MGANGNGTGGNEVGATRTLANGHMEVLSAYNTSIEGIALQISKLSFI